MKWKQTEQELLDNTEVVLNLWAYASEDGTIMRLAGKAYVLHGEDKEKLAILRALSASDFLSAPWQKVPANFAVHGPGGKTMKGAAHCSQLSDHHTLSFLFGPLIEDLAKGLPEQLRSIQGSYARFQMDLPAEPLMVTTVVMEYEDGRLVPLLSGR